MTTYLLVQAERGHAHEIAHTLRSQHDVVRVEEVGGAYDVIALVRWDGSFGRSSDAAAVARLTPGVLRALECVILDQDARPAA
jgi:hypothetical protein